jgi:putative membrane protein
VTTLVLCLDRDGRLAADRDPPLVGDEQVAALVTSVGVEDPEDARVNGLLEALRVARELRREGEDAVVALVSSAGDAVGGDRAIARQVEALVEEYGPESAVLVVNSAEDEQVVPIVESRVRVDAVDRVVVRQARDIESTYYLLKQFLGDEELRAAVLIPLGAALVAFPVLLTVADSVGVALSVVAGVVGTFFLYKGLGVDDLLRGLPRAASDAFYSGQVSFVTYVVAAGLALVGAFVGGLAATEMDQGVLLAAMRFAYESVPWLSLAALAAATGRLLDEVLREERVRSALMNLPFGIVAIGFVVRGFTAFFLENAGVIDALVVPAMGFGVLTVQRIELGAEARLVVFVVGGVCISLVGVVVSSFMNGLSIEEVESRS